MSLGNRVGPAAIALAAMLVTGLLTACSSSPQPQTTASAYFAAWAKQDWTAMQQLVSQPPAGFAAVNKAAFTSLGVHQASFTPGTTTTSGSKATEPFTERLALTGVGTITIKSTLNLVQSQGHWLVTWSPATIAPPLRPGDHLVLNVTWPTRAPILGSGGAPLTIQGDVVTIGVEGSRIKDAKAVQAALVAAGAPVSAASDAIAAAKVHPTFFEPVFTVSRDRYNQLEPTIYPIPGTVFESGNARSALTPGLAAGVVGTVGPITAQELGQLGAPYDATSIVGQTGLEQADERQLAGQPGATVTVVTPSGTKVATVATLAPHPGTAVTTTIDSAVQHTAEAALAGEKKSAALVAVNATSGDVLAAVSVNSGGFDQAIDGGFPPGSTFKVITSTALITRGLTPKSAASCPATATVDGEVFHNAEGEAPVRTLLQAF
ncbi:MAG: NTF2-like N-terminal transpeptidase domain-containing protein, partial [Streptosporangiaceae bacterium]